MTVQEIAPEVIRFGGWFSDNWATETPYCNTYLLRQGDDLVIYDTGAFRDIRQRMLASIASYQQRCRGLYVVLGHAHYDHCGNNDILEELPFAEKHLLVAEPGIPRLDVLAADRAGVLDEMAYYDVFAHFPFRILRLANRISPRLALALRGWAVARAWKGVKPMPHLAEPLRLDQCQTFAFGDVQF
ncbi:MAG: MBL fold metallo-hydrolase, partial [Chloroflexota bacterium]|nr:MBL fold metallo-hydrolase [Chloroflexota bacterium]